MKWITPQCDKAPHNHLMRVWNKESIGREWKEPVFNSAHYIPVLDTVCTLHTFIFDNLFDCAIGLFVSFGCYWVSLLLLFLFLLSPILQTNGLEFNCIFFKIQLDLSYHQNLIKLPKAIYSGRFIYVFHFEIDSSRFFYLGQMQISKPNGMRHWNEICFASTNGKCTWMLSV